MDILSIETLHQTEAYFHSAIDKHETLKHLYVKHIGHAM